MKLGNRNLNPGAIGTTPEQTIVNGYALQAGRRLNANDDASNTRWRAATLDPIEALRHE